MRCRFFAGSLLLVVGCSGQDSPDADPTTTSGPTVSATLLTEVDLTTQTDSAYALDWSADGEILAASAGVELILLHTDLTELAVLVPASGALGATVSPDGLRYATVGGLHNSEITVWDWDATTQQLTLAEEIDAGADQFAVSWSSDGQLLASLAGDRDSTIQVWDTSTWGLIDEYELPFTNSRRALNWSADSQVIYDAGEIDGEVGYFSIDAHDGTATELGRLPLEQVTAFAISADAKRVAVADDSGEVRIFEVESGALLTEFQSVAQPIDLAWNPVDGSLAILSYTTALQLWSVS